MINKETLVHLGEEVRRKKQETRDDTHTSLETGILVEDLPPTLLKCIQITPVIENSYVQVEFAHFRKYHQPGLKKPFPESYTFCIDWQRETDESDKHAVIDEINISIHINSTTGVIDGHEVFITNRLVLYSSNPEDHQKYEASQEFDEIHKYIDESDNLNAMLDELTSLFLTKVA